MGPFEIYLLKSVTALSLLYTFYWLVLRNETYYSWNRLFLLFAMVISILAPIFSFSVASLPPTIFAKVLNTVIISGNTAPAEAVNSLDLWNILSIVYISGAVFFCLRFLSSLAQIHFLYHRFPKYNYHGFRAVVLNNDQSPFTFFNILFISKIDFESGKIDETIVHEKAHKEEFHTMDILLMEIVTIVQWFNPFVWLLRHSLRSEHEFLADNRVLLEGFDKVRYQEMLFKKSLGITSFSLTNNFNYSLLKKRLKMMTTKKSSSVNKIKFFVSLPLLFIVVVLMAINLNSCAKSEQQGTPPPPPPISAPSIPSVLSEQSASSVPSTPAVAADVFDMVEVMPVYKTGNMDDVALFFKQNIIYPKSALDAKIEAKVYVHFIVGEQGDVYDVKVFKTQLLGEPVPTVDEQIITDLNSESMRVVNLLEFKPGKQDGKNVNVRFVIPVAYKL